VVDLAGVTDPEVAYLPGGHTSKRLPMDFLERRRVDALVLLADVPDPRSDAPAGATPPRYARQVEQRVLGLRGADEFRATGRIPLNTRQAYVVLRRDLDPTLASAPAKAAP